MAFLRRIPACCMAIITFVLYQNRVLFETFVRACCSQYKTCPGLCLELAIAPGASDLAWSRIIPSEPSVCSLLHPGLVSQCAPREGNTSLNPSDARDKSCRHLVFLQSLLYRTLLMILVSSSANPGAAMDFQTSVVFVLIAALAFPLALRQLTRLRR